MVNHGSKISIVPRNCVSISVWKGFSAPRFLTPEHFLMYTNIVQNIVVISHHRDTGGVSTWNRDHEVCIPCAFQKCIINKI